MKNIFWIIVVLAVAGYLGMKFVHRDTFKDGFYVNRKADFSLDIPQNWREVSADEVLGDDALTLSFSKVDARLFLTPSTAEEALFAVVLMPGNEDAFANLSIEDVARRFGSMGMRVARQEAAFIGGFDVFRVAGRLQSGLTMDIAMLGAGDTTIQLQFVGQDPVDRQVQADVDSIINSLSRL